jgi:predicted  nucleic acid-binding Zn-ribbon protein
MWNVDITNIGGIRSGETSLQRGVNVVQATNWQGKSSLLDALQTVMGTTGMDHRPHPLTEGASEGQVTLDTGVETYTVTLQRDSDGVVRTSGTVLEEEIDRVCARLFAFLGERNPIRAAVRDGGDLASLLCKPLELENIDQKIATLRDERARLETEIDEAKRAIDELPQLQEAITQLTTERDGLRERRDRLQQTVAEDEQAPLRERLSDARADHDRVESDVQRIENKIERKRSQLAEKREQLAALDVPDEGVIDTDIEADRSRIGDLNAKIDLLEDLYSANKRVLDEGQVDLVTDVERSLAGDELACWVCGADASKARLADRLDALLKRLETLREERDDLETTVERAQKRREQLERKRRRVETLEESTAELEAELEDHELTLERKRERLETLSETIDDLEARLDAEPDAEEFAAVESDLKITERELQRKRERLDELEARSERLEQLRTERANLSERIDTLRERKRTKQYELKDRFDEAMAEVIETFQPGFESAWLDPKVGPDDHIQDFELVVARDGRQASLDALSEGELELVGIVTALAGYETFDVADRVPLFMLDGIGPLASTHVHGLVDYLREETEFLVTTAYPEAGEFDGRTISPERWEVVSDRPAVT